MEEMIKQLGLENYADELEKRIMSGEVKKLVLSNDSTTDYLTTDYANNMAFFMGVSD